jgi:carbonic anhydrase
MRGECFWAGLLLLAVVAPAAAAPSWESVDVNRERKVFLDRDTVVRRAGYSQGWERADFAELQPGERTGERFQSMKSLYRYDCIARTSVPMLHVYYQADGSELRRVDVQGLNPARTVETDSVRARLLDLACNPPERKQAARTEQKAAEAPNPVRKAVFVKPAPKKPAAKVPAPKPAPARKTVKRKAEPDCPEAGAGPVKAALRSQQAGHAGHPATAWSYAGLHGPEHWGKLDPKYAQCAAGKYQSPIDIGNGAKLELEPIAFDYQPVPLRIIDNGHTVRLDADEGSSITVGGIRYALKQMHFHKPAEEVVEGRTYALSAHLVHEAADRRLAVVAVLFEQGEQPNPLLRALWPHLPLEQGRETALPDLHIDWNALLPAERGYYAYMGSLTTPPCSEGVLWLVMKTPVPVTKAQVEVFGRLYPMNARPLQASNGRLIKESM